MAPARLDLLAFGDLMLERPLAPSPFYDLMEAADLAVANLEVALTDRGHPADKLVTMKAPPACARELARIGLSVVALANNHMLDFGPEGMFQTLEALEEAPVRAVGAGRDLATALAPVFIEKNGLNVGFLAMAATLPTGFAARLDRPGIAPVRVQTANVIDAAIVEEQPGTAPFVSTYVLAEALAQARRAVAAAKRDCDALIVYMHWGVPEGWSAPAQGSLAEYQRPLGRALVEAGADAVVGNHAHVIHGIELHRGRPIFYSLGNFTSHYFSTGRRLELTRPLEKYRFDPAGLDLSRYDTVPEHGRAFVARLRLEKREAPVTAIELLPYVLDHDGEPQQPDGEQAAAILTRIHAHSAPFGTEIASDGAQGYIRLAPH